MIERYPAPAHPLLLTGKQVLCYDYLSHPEVLEETTLPQLDTFHNTLREANISEEDCHHGLRVFKLYGCCNHQRLPPGLSEG